MKRLGLFVAATLLAALAMAPLAFGGGFSGGNGFSGNAANGNPISPSSVTTPFLKADVIDAGVLNVQGQETVAGGLYVTGPVSVPQSSCYILDGAATCGTAAAKRWTWDGVDIKLMAGASTFLACNNSTGICTDNFGFATTAKIASANGARDTLSGGTKGETVTSGASCVCSSETANAVRCSVSGTTLTVTGTGTDAFNYWCNK